MKGFGKTIVKISLLVLPIVFIFSVSFANEVEKSMNENDSMYRYGALDNKISFQNVDKDAEMKNLEENPPESNLMIDNSAKKIKDIVEKQNSYIEKSENSMKKINRRNWVRNFIIGNNVGVLKFQIVQMKDQSHALGILSLDAVDDSVKSEIDSQIYISGQQQTKVADFIIKKEKGFSMFGWFVNAL